MIDCHFQVRFFLLRFNANRINTMCYRICLCRDPGVVFCFLSFLDEKMTKTRHSYYTGPMDQFLLVGLVCGIASAVLFRPVQVREGSPAFRALCYTISSLGCAAATGSILTSYRKALCAER